MSQQIVAMEKGWNEKIVFAISEFKGRHYADIRVYYEDADGEWKPTKKGIAIAVDRFAEFQANLAELEGALKAEGHLSGSQA